MQQCRWITGPPATGARYHGCRRTMVVTAPPVHHSTVLRWYGATGIVMQLYIYFFSEVLWKLFLSHKSIYTLKKKGISSNPQKRFRRYQKVAKGVESLKKRIKISTKPLKVLPVCPREEPSPAKPFFKFRTAEKGFVGKYEAFRVSY